MGQAVQSQGPQGAKPLKQSDCEDLAEYQESPARPGFTSRTKLPRNKRCPRHAPNKA